MAAVKHRVLLVEDDDSLRDVLHSVLEHKGFEVDSFPTAESGAEALNRANYACVLADFKLPRKNGLDLLKEVREASRTVPFILMTAFGSIDIAVEAMKLGANDFVTKPLEPEQLCSVLHQVIQHQRIIDRSAGTKTRRDRSFLSKNPVVQKLLAQARKVARVDSSVFIVGESGTGKELIARFIHEHSPRASQPFLAVNCAAMPADLLESEFFGHEAGAFTGATQARVGVFELASEGTLFLDEIGDMPALLQVKLLRALQEKEIKRVGGSKTIKVSPRIIAATNVNVEEALKTGKMREDLYFRLAVVGLNLPPLRERPEDIEMLADYYREYFANAMGKHSIQFSQTASEYMKLYRWPGNARELENVVERAVLLADRVIEPDHLGISVGLDFSALDSAAFTLHEIAAEAAKSAEVEAITRALRNARGNKAQAARVLGVSYKTLLNKVKEYELEDSGDGESEPPASP